MKKSIRNGNKSVSIIFWASVAIFILLIVYFATPTLIHLKQTIFPLAAVLALAFFLLGGALLFLTIKQKIQGKLKKYLILTGASSTGFFVSVLLHNLFYGLGMITANITVLRSLMGGLYAAFFIIAIFVCPIGFIVGAVGSIVIFLKKNEPFLQHHK